jgi:hypothetical protein
MAAAPLRCRCAGGSGAEEAAAAHEEPDDHDDDDVDAAAALLACLRAEAAHHAPNGAAARAAVLPQLLAAAHGAAAALACGEAPFVDVTALLRLLTWLEFGDADAIADAPGFDADDDDDGSGGDCDEAATAFRIEKGLVTRGADAALVRTLAALLAAEGDAASFAAVLLHGALCAAAAAAAEDAHAALPACVMGDVATAACAVLRRAHFARHAGAPHARLALLLARHGCHRRDSDAVDAADYAADAADVRALALLRYDSADVIGTLLALLHGAAPGDASMLCLRVHALPRRGWTDVVPIGVLHGPRLRRWWRFASLEAHIDAAATLLPEACAAGPHDARVRDALNALLAAQSRRFFESLSLDGDDDDNGGRARAAARRRHGGAYARGLACVLRADAATGGRLGVDAAALRSTLDATRAMLPPPC